MHDVGCFGDQDPAQSPGEAEIVIAGTIDVDDTNAVAARDLVDIRIRQTDEDAINALFGEPCNQPYNLLRTTIEMASGFDVHDFHNGSSMPPDIDFT